ncbi:MAG TPA: hypothetical protein VMV46_08895 [Thermoanaerobaculia bacterium]|nr:hypothetical protein [Thermoanaerobaculia bacterium]
MYLHSNASAPPTRAAAAPSAASRLLLLAFGCWALLGAAGRPAAAFDDPALALTPNVQEGTTALVRWRLNAAFRLAVERLDRRQTCRALFEGFERDGVDLLQRAVYFAAARHTRPCRRGAVAFTRVGGGPVGLCGDLFVTLDRRAAARTLIHEALHHAGQGENPPDPRAPSPFDLDLAVGRRCGL